LNANYECFDDVNDIITFKLHQVSLFVGAHYSMVENEPSLQQPDSTSIDDQMKKSSTLNQTKTTHKSICYVILCLHIYQINEQWTETAPLLTKYYPTFASSSVMVTPNLVRLRMDFSNISFFE
jgi:hypothetical protein